MRKTSQEQIPAGRILERKELLSFFDADIAVLSNHFNQRTTVI